jgi:hypothetical protein
MQTLLLWGLPFVSLGLFLLYSRLERPSQSFGRAVTGGLLLVSLSAFSILFFLDMGTQRLVSYRAISVYVCAYILVAGMILSACFGFLGKRSTSARTRLLAVVLFLAAVLAVCNYSGLGHKSYGNYLNSYEFYHYYIGAKYTKEVGYTGMYGASFIADDETGRIWKPGTKRADKRMRDLKGGKRILRPQDILSNREEYTGAFTEARWEEFVRDIVYFKKQLGPSRWRSVLRDKGFNGTPVWAMVAGTLANIVSTDSEGGMLFLSLLDVLFILTAIICVWWAFDYRAALLLVMFFGTAMVMSHSHMKGAFMRTDFTMCIVVAVCMLKKEHFKMAGILTAYAATSRIFPTVFGYGVGVLFLWALYDWYRGKAGAKGQCLQYFSFLWTMAVAVVLLVLTSIIYDGGLAQWWEYKVKILAHNDQFSPWRVGFRYIFTGAYKYRSGGDTHRAFFERHQVWWWSIQAMVLIICFFLMRKQKPHEAMALGFIPAFFLFSPTYYYYIFLIIPFLYFASDLTRPSRAIGLIMMFCHSLVLYPIHAEKGRALILFYTASCLFLSLAVYMAILCAIDLYKRNSSGDQKENVSPEVDSENVVAA